MQDNEGAAGAAAAAVSDSGQRRRRVAAVIGYRQDVRAIRMQLIIITIIIELIIDYHICNLHASLPSPLSAFNNRIK